jgi:hypothetical protein
MPVRSQTIVWKLSRDCVEWEGGIERKRSERIGEVKREGEEMNGKSTHLETALGNLGLVGRVGRVPARVFQNVAKNDGRGCRLVVAHSNKASQHLVLGHDALELGQRLRLGKWRIQAQLLVEADVRRHG